MQCEIHVTKENDFLRINAIGSLSRDSMVSLAKAVVESSAEYNCTKEVVDLSNLAGTVGAVDIYKVVDDVIDGLVPPGALKIAVIGNKDLEQETRFLETVSRNSGYNLLVFDDVEDAVNWLKE